MLFVDCYQLKNSTLEAGKLYEFLGDIVQEVRGEEVKLMLKARVLKESEEPFNMQVYMHQSNEIRNLVETMINRKKANKN